MKTNLISRTTGEKTGYYFYNGHGDVTGIISTDGKTTLATYYYDPFGVLKEFTGSFDNPYRYSGYQYDTETGTYYLMCRVYDPETGRFLQEDTYTGKINDPLSLNLYIYCHNEPLMYSDPTGHFWKELWGGIKKVGSVIKTAFDDVVSAGTGLISGVFDGLVYKPLSGMLKIATDISSINPTAHKYVKSFSDNINNRIKVTKDFINSFAKNKKLNQKFQIAGTVLGVMGGMYATGAVAGGFLKSSKLAPVAQHFISNFASGSIPTALNELSEGKSWGNVIKDSTFSGLICGGIGLAFDAVPMMVKAAKPYAASLSKKMATAFGDDTDMFGNLESFMQGKKPGFVRWGSSLGEGADEASEWSSEKGIYSVAYEAKLPEEMYPGVSSPRHFQEANKQLYETFQKDSSFAQQMEELYPGINKGVQPGARGAFSRNAPTRDVTWHHNAEREGILQLVPRNQHTASGPIQQVLHPGGRGGMEIWGGGR